jgi:transposase
MKCQLILAFLHLAPD